MRIEKIIESDEYYLICYNNNTAMVWRKRCETAADDPLSMEEETIVALCDKLAGAGMVGK